LFPPEEAGGICPAPSTKKSAPYDSKRAVLAPGPWKHLAVTTLLFKELKCYQIQKGLTLSKTPIQKTQIATILGEGSEFEGKLVFEGTVQVEGKFIGQVQSQGTFIIGEKALVRAEIQAGIVLVRGEVHGTITARSRIEAYAPAKIFGDLSAPVLVFGEGILFQGTSHMIPMEEGKQDAKPFSSGPTEIGP